MSGQKTFWHLLGARHKPSDYEIVTSRLQHHAGRVFEVGGSVAPWYRDYQQGSLLRCADWDRFADPKELTYSRYIREQVKKEAFVQRLFRLADETTYDDELPDWWLDVLEGTIGPLRYPVHGLQMVAGYLGSLAPGGRLTIVCLLQTANEIRRIETLAYRTAQLRRIRADFACEARERWQDASEWQPLRRLVERLMVTFDWGEAFVALNLAVKPALDGWAAGAFGPLAAAIGDPLLFEILASLEDDCRWQRDWTCSLVRLLLSEDEANRKTIGGWLDSWAPASLCAVNALEGPAALAPAGALRAYGAGLDELARERGLSLRELGLRGPELAARP